MSSPLSWDRIIPFSVPLALYFISLFIVPMVHNDSAISFLVLRSMIGGAEFNHVLSPDPVGIGRDVSSFQAHWRSGHLRVPVLIRTHNSQRCNKFALVLSLIKGAITSYACHDSNEGTVAKRGASTAQSEIESSVGRLSYDLDRRTLSLD